MFATSYLGGDVTIRFRPSFFPFTEPSVEATFCGTISGSEFAVLACRSQRPKSGRLRS